MRHIVATGLKKGSVLRCTMSSLGGKSMLMAAYVSFPVSTHLQAELVFHPFKDWLRRGPFTPLFRAFLASQIPGASKFTIMAYIGTYYAIGSAWIMLMLNYFLTGWCSAALDQYYLSSFGVFVTVIAVFTVAGPIMNAILKYRCKMNSFVDALVENYMWVPMFVIFFGGLSMHISYALLCYLFSVDLQWGATAKVCKFSSLYLTYRNSKPPTFGLNYRRSSKVLNGCIYLSLP